MDSIHSVKLVSKVSLPPFLRLVDLARLEILATRSLASLP